MLGSFVTRRVGAAALEAAVELFYEKNASDERINAMFENRASSETLD